MLKVLSKLLLPSAKMIRRTPYIKLPLYPSVITRWHSFTSPRPTKQQIALNQQLLNAKTRQEVITIYETSKNLMNLVNMSALIKQLNDFQKGSQQPLSHSFCSEVLISVLHGIEKENVADARLCSSLYFHINRFHGSSKLKAECNKHLEEKGMNLYQQMNSQELTNFVYTLAQNDKKEQIQLILPFIASKLESHTLRALTSILYAIALADIRDATFGAKVQDFFINSKEPLKPNAHDYSLIFFYCGKNPDIMYKPEFFKKLEHIAKFQVSHCNEIALANIFHSLTFYETPMMSAEFYQLFETHILNSLAKMNNRSLSLILRGYSTFGFGSETFYNKMMEEAKNRINSFDTEAFSTIMYHLATKKHITDDFLEASTQRLDLKNIAVFSTRQFQHILYAFSTLVRENLYKPNSDLIKALVWYILHNIDNFTFQELGNVASLSSLAGMRSQAEIAVQIRERIMKTDGVIPELVDLRALSDIMFFNVHEFPDTLENNFASRLIDITLQSAKNIETLKEFARINNLRHYGKLVLALSEVKGLDKEYENKRKQIIQAFESWLIENCNNSLPPQDFSLEGTLMHFIMSFYIVLDSPRNETKQIFRNALSLLKDIKPENLDFLTKHTDLLNKVE